MPSELTEVREYNLTIMPGGKMIYSLTDATIHPDEEAAHSWVSFRIQQEGYGDAVRTEAGILPGHAWTTVQVQAVEHQIIVGTDIEDAPIMMPEFDFEDEFPSPVDDAPLPPDEDPL